MFKNWAVTLLNGLTFFSASRVQGNIHNIRRTQVHESSGVIAKLNRRPSWKEADSYSFTQSCCKCLKTYTMASLLFSFLLWIFFFTLPCEGQHRGWLLCRWLWTCQQCVRRASRWQECLLPVGSAAPVSDLSYLITETLFAPVCWDVQTVGALLLAETESSYEIRRVCLCIDLIELCANLVFAESLDCILLV